MSNNNSHRVIFLDIDGVLNVYSHDNSNQTDIRKKEELVDVEKVRLLACLVKKTNAKIILHSGWKFWFDCNNKPLREESEYLVELLQNEGLKISGFTPDFSTEDIKRTKKFSLVKADEILSWLKEHKDVIKWVVLDDLDLNNEQVAKHQVKINHTVGLTIEDIEKAESILFQE